MMNLPLPNDRLNAMAAELGKNMPSPPAGHDQLKKLPLSEFLKPMMTAVRQSQPWIDDFGNDTIMLPVDLYEVIKEFARLQKRQAS